MDPDQAFTELVEAIRYAQSEIRWKPGSASRHLLKRKLREHLPMDATLEEYQRLIQTILVTNSAEVYIYHYSGKRYPTIISSLDGKLWLIMLSLEGIIETAFVVENPGSYLAPPYFEHVALLGEILS